MSSIHLMDIAHAPGNAEGLILKCRVDGTERFSNLIYNYSFLLQIVF